MDFLELKEDIIAFFQTTLPDFFRKFPQKSLGEQLAYACIGLGILLIIISLFLF